MEDERMVQQALHHISENRVEGDLLMDVPPSLSWDELRNLALNRDAWRVRVHNLANGNGVEIKMNDALTGRKAPL